VVGDRLTDADIRLFATLIRFDQVYVGHFKCNLRRLVDYPRLWDYKRRHFQHPKIRPTVEHGAHQGPLLRQPYLAQPQRHCRSGQFSISTRRFGRVAGRDEQQD